MQATVQAGAAAALRVSGLAVRRSVGADVDAVAAVLRDAFDGHRASYTPAAYAATTPDAMEVRRRLGDGPTWVAVVDGAVVGTVSALPKGDALYVRSMAVLPSARGNGAGRRLMEAVEAFAVGEGFRRMTLSTAPFLLEAIRLYERGGFVRTGEGPHDLAGTPLLGMEKRLAHARRT